MATVRFSINPEDSVESVVVAAGAAVVTKKIELTIEQAASVTDAGGIGTNPRPINRKEVLVALQVLIERLQRDDTTIASL